MFGNFALTLLLQKIVVLFRRRN